ncbi:MAG: 50S ribosomal protein L9 [Nitrospirota bacterium]
MQIILQNDISGVGKKGEIKNVSEGYARNFLIPKGFGIPATESNLKKLHEDKKRIAVLAQREKESAIEFSQGLKNISITISRKAGEENKIFGSVTKEDIVDALSKKGFKIDKKMVDISQPIKLLGVYTIPIKLHKEVETKASLRVVKE